MREENLAAAEGGEVAVIRHGMAAVNAARVVPTATGDQIVARQILFGTHSLLTSWLPRYKIRTDFCDLTKPESLTKVATQNCQVVYRETPVDPTMELIDLRAIRQLVDRLNEARAEAAKICIVVDNTFAPPYRQRPLQHGVDIVVHSLTKDVGGFGTEMRGAVIGPGTYCNLLMLYRKDFGGVLSPKNAWPLLVYGLPTLAAADDKPAEKRDGGGGMFAKVRRVVYPGLAAFAQRELAYPQMTTLDGSFAPATCGILN